MKKLWFLSVFLTVVFLSGCVSNPSLKGDYNFVSDTENGFLILGFTDEITRQDSHWGFPTHANITFKSDSGKSLVVRKHYSHEKDFGDGEKQRGHLYVLPIKPGKWKLTDWEFTYGGLVTTQFFGKISQESTIDIKAGEYVFIGDVAIKYAVAVTWLKYPDYEDMSIEATDNWDSVKPLLTSKYQYLPVDEVKSNVIQVALEPKPE
ncbi:hypothetical protein KFE80_12125 [bacterium SCSIO 12696]|nr:hypothetical protein KFE80_12125 [bacterium SCSIO 12696]